MSRSGDCMILPDRFCARDAQLLARQLRGKVIRLRQGGLWLAARIIETEASYAVEKGSQASLGYIEQPQAIFQERLMAFRMAVTSIWPTVLSMRGIRTALSAIRCAVDQPGRDYWLWQGTIDD